IDRFQVLGASVLTGGTVMSGSTDVTAQGHFEWDATGAGASLVMAHAGDIAMPVVWVPDVEAVPDPSTGALAPGPGFVRAYCTVVVRVAQTVDKGELERLVDGVEAATSTPGDVQATLDAYGLYEENFTAAAWAAFVDAYQRARDVLADWDATQPQVDDAYAALDAAYAALAHDHPVLDANGAAGADTAYVFAFGEGAEVRWKGYIGSVTSFELDARALDVVAEPSGYAGGPEWLVMDGTDEVGAVYAGSARVALSAAFLDRLPDGTYPLRLGFADVKGQGSGTGYLVVQRTAPGGGSGGGPGGGGSGGGPGGGGAGGGSGIGGPGAGVAVGDGSAAAQAAACALTLCALAALCAPALRRRARGRRG
ncbi:MAG: hypothetical protein LBG81_04015, partial [Coriobacteriaceae bacterium]|nr:hypothetical protein [Coriobacteriaceae bacterium]